MNYEVWFYTKSGDQIHLPEVSFSETPQIGWTLRIPEVRERSTGVHSVGVVTEVNMLSDGLPPQIMVKEKVTDD